MRFSPQRPYKIGSDASWRFKLIALVACLLVAVLLNISMYSYYNWRDDQVLLLLNDYDDDDEEDDDRNSSPSPSASKNQRQQPMISAFDNLAQELHSLASNASSINEGLQKKNKNSRKKFDLSTWTDRTTGGLHDLDRIKLGEIYGRANSVFEWGLGESTRIAAHVGVKRYVGIDSDSEYVQTLRNKSPDHFRFYFADVGPTGMYC